MISLMSSRIAEKLIPLYKKFAGSQLEYGDLTVSTSDQKYRLFRKHARTASMYDRRSKKKEMNRE